MDFSASAMFASLVVSAIGMGFFIYGKKQARGPQLGAGMALMVSPYILGSTLPMLGLATVILLGMQLALRYDL